MGWNSWGRSGGRGSCAPNNKITNIELAVPVIASSDAAPYPALSAVISMVPVASVAKVQGDPYEWAGQFILRIQIVILVILRK